MKGFVPSGAMRSVIADDVYVRSIATTDYAPVTADTALNAAEIGALKDNGFYVKPDTDGALYVITLAQYKKNKNSITGLTPVDIGGLAGFYEPVPVVLVKAKNDATYASASTNIRVGTIVA